MGIHREKEHLELLEETDVESLEDAKNYINIKNGLVNLDTMELEKHRKDIFTTSQLPIEYNQSAKCPQFFNFLNDIFNDDKDLIKLVQEIMGYCISMEVKADKMFIFLGEGSNGKSVLSQILMALCGKENVSSVPMKKLGKAFSRYSLVDKVLNLATETELGTEGLNTEEVKIITSGDPIYVEKKFEDGYMTQLFVKLLFCANRLPYSRDKSYGFQRRLVIVPFNKTYVDEPKNDMQGKKDSFLQGKLMKELDGILVFALEGFKRLKNNSFRFTKAKISQEVVEEYKHELNPFLDFIKDNISETDIKYRLESRTLYRMFLKWSENNNHKNYANITINKFLREFRSALKNENYNYEDRKSNGIQYFNGLKERIVLGKKYKDF